MDTQQIEILGRNRLISELVAANLEVALPIRDRGIDLLVYADLNTESAVFTACPVQMKAASAQYFGVHHKYNKFSQLIIAYVWGLGNSDAAETYAMTQSEAVAVAEQMGWTDTRSWREMDGYSTSKPSAKLLAMLEPYRMTPAKWRERVVTLQVKVTERTS